MFPSDYSDFKQPKQPSIDPSKSQVPQTNDIRNNLKYFQEKIKEANQPSLSLHNKIHLLRDLEIKILQTHGTDALEEVRYSLAQLQLEACNALGEQYEICKGMSEEDKMQLYTSIPEDAMKDVMGAGKELITPEMDHLEKVQILLGIQKIFTARMIEFERYYIIEALAEVAPVERADVINRASRLLTESMNGMDRGKIINEVAQVPQADRADVIDWALKLVTEKMRGYEKAQIINKVAQVPQADRADVIGWASFTETMSGFMKGSLIGDLSKIPPAEREDVISCALKLFTEKMSSFDGGLIIRALAQIPRSERADVVDWALKLNMESMKNSFMIPYIILDIAKVPQEDRADVISWALFTETMNGLEKGSLIRHIAQIPQADRADVVDWALKLTTEQMDGTDKYAYLEKVLAKIPQELREDIAGCAPALFTETMSGIERALIVRALFKIAQEGRLDVIDMFISYLPKTNSGFEVVDLIADYRQIVHLEMTPKLFTKIQGSYNRSFIVGALVPIPPNEREDFIGYILQLFPQKGASPYDIIEAIYFIKDIPFSARKTLFEDSSSLCNASMTWSEKITVLHVMKNTPYQQEDLKQAEKYFTPKMSWREKLDLFLCSAHHLNLDEILKPAAAVSEEDFEDLVEEDLARILEDLFTPLPQDSIFADTDLVICKEDFPHTLPLNGIKLSELKEIEALALQIFSGSGKIKIFSYPKQFEKQVQGYIKKLLTRPIGRKLIKKVMESQHLNTLTIRSGTNSCYKPSDSIIYLSENENLANPKQKTYMQPPFIVLGHELIHASHADSSSSIKKPPTIDPDYDDLEEQITIAGFKQNIELPESLNLVPGFEKNMEWLKSLNVEEGWEEEPIFTEDNFDPINERNLHAAFANSKELFYPRASHRGFAREKVVEDPSVALSFAKARIANHLTQSKLKAPLNLHKVYDKLINITK